MPKDNKPGAQERQKSLLFTNSQNSHSPSSSVNSGRYRKFFIRGRTTVGVQGSTAASSAAREQHSTLQSSKQYAGASTSLLHVGTVCSVSVGINSKHQKINEVQRKFPLWLPEYKTNAFNVS